MRISKDQLGFSAIEALLIIIVLSILGGTSYYVFHAKQNADKNLSSNPSVGTAVKKEIYSGTKTDQTQYLQIKEWGVEIPLANTIEDAYYVYKNNDNQSDYGSVYIGTKSLTALDPNCAADGIAFGTIGRQIASVHDVNVSQPSGIDTPVYPTKIGNYYYGYNHAQAACSDNDTINNKQQADAVAFKAAVEGIKPL